MKTREFAGRNWQRFLKFLCRALMLQLAPVFIFSLGQASDSTAPKPASEISADVTAVPAAEADEALKFASVDVATVPDSVEETVRELLATELPETKLEIVQTRSAKSLAAGHGKDLREMISDMVTRLGVADDPRDVTVLLNSDSTINAFLEKDEATKKVIVHVNSGTLAFANNQDELAFIFAHEMTHANPNLLRFKDDPAKVKDLLGSLPTMSDPIQAEELRADVGAIHRMIKGKYNPWGAYDFFKRIANYEEKIKQQGKPRSSNERAVRSFLAGHPASELRMSVVKSYVTARQSRENLLPVTSKYNEFSPRLKLLHWRLAAYSAFANANKVRLALKTGILAAAGIATQTVTALMVSPDTAQQLGILLAPGNELAGGITSVIEYLRYGPPPEAYTGYSAVTPSAGSSVGGAVTSAVKSAGGALGPAVDNSATGSIEQILEFGRYLRDMPAEQAAKVISGISGTGAASTWAVNKLKLNAKNRALDLAFQEALNNARRFDVFRKAQKRTVRAVGLHRELMAAGEFDRTGTLVRAIELNRQSADLAENIWDIPHNRKKYKFGWNELETYSRNRLRKEAIDRQVLLNELIEQYLPRLSEKKAREIANALDKFSEKEILDPELAASFDRMIENYRRLHPQVTFSKRIERLIAAKNNAMKFASGNMASVMRKAQELTSGSHVILSRQSIPNSQQPNQALKYVSKSKVGAEGAAQLILENLDGWLSEIETGGDRGEQARTLFLKTYSMASSDIFDRDPSKTKERYVEFRLDVLEKIKTRSEVSESVRLQFLGKMLGNDETGSKIADKVIKGFLDEMDPWKRFWKNFDNTKTLIEVDDLVSSKFIAGQGLSIDAEPLNSLYRLIEVRPELIATPADIERFLDKEYLWNRMGSGYPKLDDKIVDSMRKKLGAKNGADLWKYRPQASEKFQRLILDKMKQFGMAPANRSDQLKLWQRFVGRGVTSTTDRLFAELYDSGTPADRRMLREVSAGRIWEPQLRARVLKDKLREMPQYQTLVSSANELNPSRDTVKSRVGALRDIIRTTEAEFEGRGPDYDAVVESVLKEAKSSQFETRFAERYRGPIGKGQADITLRTLSSLTEKVKAMSLDEKWDYILWLRGEKAASKTIEDLFPVVGADRVARMYSLLPDYQKALVIDTVLDSKTGLLPDADVNSKWGRKIVEHLIGSGKGDDAEAMKARQVAKDVLEAYLDSFSGPGANKSQRTLVLSYMLASKSGDGSNGRVLKQVLEAMGASGVKIGQFIVAADILGDKDNEILRKLQDQANVPQRSRIYQDLAKASGGAPIPGKIDDLLGAASVKYAVKALDVEDGHPFVLKVLREEASATIGQQFARLRAMSETLNKKHKGKYSVLRSIIRASEEAVNRELVLKNEVRNSADATRLIYEKLDDFKVPKEALLDDSVIKSEFASGGSIHELSVEKRGEAAKRIIEIEGANLFADQDVIYFDPDRHPGNFKIDFDGPTVGGEKTMRIKPIDFGQLISITKAERQNVIDLFAQSAILDQTGSTKWSAEKIAKALNLPKEKVGKLKSALANGFPAKNRSGLASYYTLLAALEDIGHPQPIQYFDFARAVVQHNQYESMVVDSLVAKGKTEEVARTMVRTPRDELTERITKSASVQMDGDPFGKVDKLRIVWNQGSKKVEEFVTEKTRMPREQLKQVGYAIKDFPSECALWFKGLKTKK